MRKVFINKFIIISLLSIGYLSYGWGNSWNQNIMDEQNIKKAHFETATLGGGCFWCVEAIYQDLKGVEKVESGYAGGSIKNPTYQEVCSGLTGHAEVTNITFDPDIISFKELLDVFWEIHDPTTLNRQGADIGTQYRSVIFYHDQNQKVIAESSLNELELSGVYKDPVVTEIVPFTVFYKAENYHQDYFSNNPNQPYCRMVISPKVAKFRKKYKNELKR